MRIQRLTISGFKSLRAVELELNDLNVLIGSNGAGKSNFVSWFRMMGELVAQRLGVWVARQGGMDRLLTFGPKETEQLQFGAWFGDNGYRAILESAHHGGAFFASETLYYLENPRDLGSGHEESRIESELASELAIGRPYNVPGYCREAILRWKAYQFHDTSEAAKLRRWGELHDNAHLRLDGSNLSAFLYRLHRDFPEVYQQIRATVRLALPFFDDFVLQTRELPTQEEQIILSWRQRGSDYLLWPSQFSDGSLRFICLVTALLQPTAPSTIVIDEPELGLHPTAIALLGALLRSAAHRMQVIVATQSVSLVNEFAVGDLIVMEREPDGSTVFKRHAEAELQTWLESYSVGELWEKNLLGGRPPR